ncbi:MAG: polysialic acid transporter [endosymbiont of Escarpia spicata]|uniref:Transport permease protein n=1 Tax=endosymbiont of Escarpia spicata TaxID=2200908 RepID=A0A370DLU9_9GAMM|nr:MAG: polysialic acid transporter [endosymbiont of Escarpia spicata]
MSRSPFEIQKSVVFALFVRELKTRFGKYRLGYVWALLEPMTHVIVLSIIWSAMGRSEFAGIPVPLFLATGIVPFLFFRTTATRCMNAIESNRGLFNYRQVRPVDPVLARIILESIVYFASYLMLLFIAGWFLDYEIGVHDLLGLIVVNALLYLLTFGIGLTFSVYGTLYPEIMKLVPLLVFRPMYFMSGILFPLFVVPTEYHHWLLWNPLLHVVELNHLFYFRGFESGDVSLLFVLLFALASTTFGLLSYRANWVRMVAT